MTGISQVESSGTQKDRRERIYAEISKDGTGRSRKKDDDEERARGRKDRVSQDRAGRASEDDGTYIKKIGTLKAVPMAMAVE